MLQDDHSQRLLAIEFQLGIRQDIRPRTGMRYKWASEDGWTTILGTWRDEKTKKLWWVVQTDREPYLTSDANLMRVVQNPKMVIDEA